MAASKTYNVRPNYLYLSSETNNNPLHTDPIFELDESDLFHPATSSPEFLKTHHRKSNKPLSPAVNLRQIGGSLPVNVPDWSKILKEDYSQNRRKNDGVEDEYSDEFDDGDGGGGYRIPPHEFLARSRIASCSVHEGIGRTLKGRDLSRVRNAVWEKIGFQD